MGPKTTPETKFNQQSTPIAMGATGNVAKAEASQQPFTITGSTEAVGAPQSQNPTQNNTEGYYQTQIDPRIAQAQAQPPVYVESAPLQVAQAQPPVYAESVPPTQNSAESYYQVPTPQPETQPQTAPAPQAPTQNGAESYYQPQIDPRIAQAQAQAQAQAAFTIPSEPIKLTPQEFSPPAPTPEQVVVGADTSSPDFPGRPQKDLSPVTPTENSSNNFVDTEALKKEYDPMVIEAIHKVMGLAEIQLAEADGDVKKEEAVIKATTNSLTDINRIVIGIKPLEEPAA